MKKRKKNSLILLKHTFEMGFMMHVGPKRIWAEYSRENRRPDDRRDAIR